MRSLQVRGKLLPLPCPPHICSWVIEPEWAAGMTKSLPRRPRSYAVPLPTFPTPPCCRFCASQESGPFSQLVLASQVIPSPTCLMVVPPSVLGRNTHSSWRPPRSPQTAPLYANDKREPCPLWLIPPAERTHQPHLSKGHFHSPSAQANLEKNSQSSLSLYSAHLSHHWVLLAAPLPYCVFQVHSLFSIFSASAIKQSHI